MTESVFAWPGMGKLIIDSINVLDRPVIVAYLMMIVLLFVTINLVVDLLYTVLDPRVRLEAKGDERSRTAGSRHCAPADASCRTPLCARKRRSVASCRSSPLASLSASRCSS